MVVRLNFKNLVLQRQVEEGRQITQKEIADALDVSEHTIGNWMRGDAQKVDLEMLARVMQFFNCQLDDVLKVETVEN